MKYGVLITSAANATFSMYSSDQRVEQTVRTIESVNKYIPNAVVCLTDCSVLGLSDQHKAKLISLVDHFVDLSKDSVVNWIADNVSHQDTVKNLTELVVVGKFLRIAKEQRWFEECDRIFKVSGRYWLNENFNIARYQQPDVKGKYVVSKKMLSQFKSEVTTQALQYMLRVYSFDYLLLDDFIGQIDVMTSYLQERANAGGYIDIEHLFCKFLPNSKVLEIARTGVSGNIAPNGMFIEN